ncbi:thiamine phosphate synthase [Novosphingobium sp.]|uniref:thiamine phosphate synthase n=1 Tax=Novosphingobium sp. TaxID=1874826 RepID=UPI0025DECFFB|nr:thiamine phosphate synthase [Novosphingobium sp.]
MARLKPLPAIWIISDARNDAALEYALARLPRGSGVVFRHYHLASRDRRARFDQVKRLAQARGHVVALSGNARTARRWGADAAYGSVQVLAPGPALPRLVAVHSLWELAQVKRGDAILLSPVFETRTHPNGKTLGPRRFRLIAARSALPVIALGGMNSVRAKRLKWPRWAAIDAFCDKATPRIPLDS